MSIRAYRVTKLEYDQEPAFNCWHDSALMEFLERDNDTMDSRNQNGQGLIDVHAETLQRALDTKELEIDPEVRKAIEANIAWAKENAQEYLVFNCL